MVSLSFAGLSCALIVGWVAYRDVQADSLVAEALERLHAPLEEAPGLDRVQASTAASLLARAAELGHTDYTLDGWAAYAQALEDYQRGDMVLAEGELTSARHRLGRNAEVEVLAAAVARGRSQTERAEELLADALSLNPENVHGHLLAADIALDAGDGEAALTHLDRLVHDAPRVGPLRNRRGLARELAGRIESAESDYLEAVRLDPRAFDAWINVGRLRRLAGRHAEALEAFEQAVRRAPTDPDAHLGRGLSRAALGDVQGARADFERSAELGPNDAEPLLALGDLQRDLGAYTQAVDTYRTAISREDADAASWLKLGNVLALLERYDESSRAFRAAIRRAPELAAAYNGLGASLMHLGHTHQAVRALESGERARPTRPEPADEPGAAPRAERREAGGRRGVGARARARPGVRHRPPASGAPQRLRRGLCSGGAARASSSCRRPLCWPVAQSLPP